MALLVAQTKNFGTSLPSLTLSHPTPSLLVNPTRSFFKVQVCLVLWCFSLLPLTNTAFFTIEGLQQPCLQRGYLHIFFPVAFAHSVSLCHILVILTTWQFFFIIFYYICYGYPWSVTFDVTIVTVFGHHKDCPFKTENLTDVCILSTKHCLPSLQPCILYDPTIQKVLTCD